jgi:hypothetical protein
MTSSEDVFDKEMRALLEHLAKIMHTNEKGKLKLDGKINPIVKFLNKYTNFYNKTTPADHKEYLIEIFEQNRAAILKGPQKDNWLRNNKIVIQPGDGTQKVFREIKIMLSTIYNTACDLRDDANERLDGLPDSAYQDCQELNFPDVVMLHLFRIFREIVIDPKDQKQLIAHVQEIEGLLGIESGSANNLPPALSGAINAATGFLSQFGINIPKDKMPTEQDFGNILGSILQSPQTQQVFGSIFKDMDKCEDPQQAIGKLFGALQQNPIATEVIGSIGQTVNGAVNAGSEIGDPVPAATPIEAKVNLPD